MLLDGLRYLDIDLRSLERLTLVEYRLLMQAYALRKIDERKEEIELEFVKRALKATEEKGKKSYYVVKDVKDIFDYEEAEKKILGVKEDEEKFDRLRQIALRLREFKRKEGEI